MWDFCKVLKLQRWLYWLHLLKVDSTSNVCPIPLHDHLQYFILQKQKKKTKNKITTLSAPSPILKICIQSLISVLLLFFLIHHKSSILPFCHKCVPKYFGTISLSVILTALSHLPFFSSPMNEKWVERKREEGEKNVSTSLGQLKSLLLKTWQAIQPLKVLTQGNAWNVYSLINLLGGDLKFPHSWICGWQRDFSVVTSYLNNRAKRLC